MSALDHAFIRAYTSETTATMAAPSKSTSQFESAGEFKSAAELKPIGDELFASQQSVGLPERAAALMNRTVDPSGIVAGSSIVPPPHMNLSAFAHTVTTSDAAVDEPKRSAFRAVRIDPPQFLAGSPAMNNQPEFNSKPVEPKNPLQIPTVAENRSPKVSTPPSPIPAPSSMPMTSPAPMPSASTAILDSPTPNTAALNRPRAAFEVDHFAWPTACQSLVDRVAPQLDQLCRDLIAESALGRKVIAITGLQRNEGRTTVALLLARRLAASGVNVSLVDADFSSPQLANRLGLVIGAGWEQAVAVSQGPELWETMIESVADHLTVAPLASRTRLTVAGDVAERVGQCLKQLRDQFELVLVDAGPMTSDGGSAWMLTPNSGLDAAILTTDTRAAHPSQLAELSRRLMDANIPPLGVAENYCVL